MELLQPLPHLLLFVEDAEYSLKLTLVGLQKGILYTCEGEVSTRHLYVAGKVHKLDMLSIIRKQMELKILALMLENERQPTTPLQ